MRTETSFPGDSEMSRRMRAFDWSRAGLGAPAAWPAALSTAVSICLNSRYPMFVWWGPRLVNFYNDAYIPVLGARHPDGLGRPARELWSEVWDVLGPQAHTVMTEGRASWNDRQLLVMQRNNFVEETYFSWSYSPVFDAAGAVQGVFCACTEETARVLGERRLLSLHALATMTAESHSAQDACRLGAEALAQNPHDIPLAAIYLREPEGELPRRVAGVRIEAHAVSFPEALSPEDLAREPWRGLPAMLLPIAGSASEEPAGWLIAGLNPRRPFDAEYGRFLELAAGQLAKAIADARAFEAQRKRAETLAQLDRAKTAFFSNVSHELRTPLTLMLGPVEDLLARPAGGLAPGDREVLELVRRSGERLLKLVNTLLEFSRIEAGRVQASYEPAELAAVTAELASNFRSACERAGIALEVDCAPLEAPVHVDRDMWERIVFNLLSNALKFTLAGSIRVSVARKGERAVLAVRDTGSGIPQAELPRLFERFHRVEGARGRTHEGTGIGLALVHELVKLHGGAVRAESAEGEGSTFTVELPFGSAHLPAERVKAAGSPVASGASAAAYLGEALGWLREGDTLAGAVASGTRPRVLIADDNADLREYLLRLLGARYEVEAAADGERALEAARRRRPDLVLADVMMPRLDGFGLLRALRADEALQSVPLVLVSARAGEEARIEGLERGADDYIVKPFGARELLARVGAQLEIARVRGAAEASLRASADELRRADRQKDELMAMLAHELRNPLAAIGLSAEILERARIAGPRAAFAVPAIGRQVAHMRRLTDDLLDVARLTFGKLALRKEPLELLGAAREVAARYAQSAGGAAVEAAGGQAWSDADPVRVRQMLDNLVENALKFGARHVRIRAAATSARAELVVEDDGQGFAPEQLPELLKPFVQGEQALDRMQGGLGLGLALVERLALLHGGTLEARSGGPGKGAEFTLSLPRAAAAPASAGKPPPTPRPRTRRRVLVVEDEADSREALRVLLEMQGHKVSIAGDGADGLAKLGELRPHVALVDVGLPGMDGYELARRAQSLPWRRQMTLVAVTGYGLDEDRRKAAEAGFDLYFTKPVSYEQLAQALDGA